MDQNHPRATQAEAQPGTAHPDAAPAQPGAVQAEAGAAQAGPAQTQPGTAQAAPVAPPPQHVVRRTRAGGLWVALALSAVVLLLLLIFILENGRRADIALFGAHASVPLGVALLLAAVAGALVVIIPGTARIVQLRFTARRHRQMDAATATPATQPPANPGPGA
jgi:uncharacterized integral membrane protein